MAGITHIIFISAVLFINFAGLGNKDDKIYLDLIGNSVQSTDEEQYWTFRNGEPLEYAILERKLLGTQKAKRLYTTIYVRTRSNTNTEKKQYAEGIVEIVYMKSRSGSNYYVSHINQLGFKILPLTPEIESSIAEMEEFWREFSYSVCYDNKEKVAEMIEFPFSTARFGNYGNKESLLKNYENVFRNEIKISVENSILVPSEKPKGRIFDFTTDEYNQLSNYDSQMLFDEHLQYFVAKKINGKFKVIALREKL
jgi:hypothetical protein